MLDFVKVSTFVQQSFKNTVSQHSADRLHRDARSIVELSRHGLGKALPGHLQAAI